MISVLRGKYASLRASLHVVVLKLGLFDTRYPGQILPNYTYVTINLLTCFFPLSCRLRLRLRNCG
jgi:hypothetical protein